MNTINNSSSRIKQVFFFVLALVSMFIVKEMPIADSIKIVGEAELNQIGQATLGVLIFALIMWMTEAMPFHITGLLSIVLLTLFKVDSFGEIVKAGFGNDTVTFFIGMLILSAFVSSSGLGKRIGVWILSKTGNNTHNIVFGFIVTGTLLSMWIANMAVAAMLTPLAVAILKEEGVKPYESNFGKALLISCIWGSLIGGVATPSGASPNAIAVGLIREMAGIEITFGLWMLYGVPAALLMAPVAYVLLMLFFKPEIKVLSKTKEELKQELHNFPPMDREERITLFLFLLTVLLWLGTPVLKRILGISIPIAMPVLFTACLFFIPGATNIKWKEIESQISWNGILLIVSGISLGMMLYTSGAARWLSVVLLSGIGTLPVFIMIFVIIFFISILKIFFSSNAVTATIIIPIVIELALSLRIPVMTIALPASLVASFSFILVTSSPTNVIAYSAGYFSIADYAKSGLLMTLFGSIILTTIIFVLGSLTGIY